MRLGIDATPLLGARTGVGRYVEGLISGLATLPEPPEFVLTAFSWRRPPGMFATRRAPARVLRALWRRLDWPPVEWLSGPVDVFHGTNYVTPPTHGGSVISLHDLSYLHHAETVEPATLAYRALVPRALRRGAHVLTLTQAIAAEVSETYGLPAERVHLARPGVDSAWLAATPLRPAGVPADYVLFVGNREPRKNLPVLLDALRRMPDAPPLVLVGPPGWGDALDLTGVECVTPGHLDTPALRGLVAGALVLVLPSRYEGFGLPPLEALACGVPVVVSDIPAHREVLGDLATYAPVGDADALTAAITGVLERGGGTAAERAARRHHAAAYTWERCAAEAMVAYAAARATPAG